MDLPTNGLQPTKDEIEGRIRGHARMKGVELFLDGITESDTAPTGPDGSPLPYAILTFGTRSRTGQVAQGIVGTRSDLKMFNFGVEIYAKNGREVGRVEDDMVDILEGFTPINAGEISVWVSGPVTSAIETKTNHSRDGRGLVFQCFTNTVTPNQ